MYTPFDELKPFKFSDIEFPFKTYRIQGGVRKHEFNFPHTPGGVTELLGRKLYEIHVTASFTQGLVKKYPNLWGSLAKLRKLFERQVTGFANIPHIGIMQVFADSWTESATDKNRSTVEVEMVFTEDLTGVDDRLDPFRLQFNGIAAASSSLDTFNAEALRQQLLLDNNTQNIFSAINDVCSSVLGIKDQADLYGSLIISKIDSATAILKDADQQVNELNNPDFWPLLDALQDLWFSMISLQQDVQQTGAPLKVFTLPIRMGISQASTAIFGDSTMAVELMQLNMIDDPLSIPAGFQIKYYDRIQ